MAQLVIGACPLPRNNVRMLFLLLLLLFCFLFFFTFLLTVDVPYCEEREASTVPPRFVNAFLSKLLFTHSLNISSTVA